MSVVINIADVPNQNFSVTLNGQNCFISVYQEATGLFMDLSVNGALLLGGVVCENLNRIVRDAYLGFQGDLAWFDTQGLQDPNFPGLGTRYQLRYYALGEVG